MVMREAFLTELKDLKDEIRFLGERVQEFYKETNALILDKNFPAIQDIIEQDEEINRIELDINEKVTLMIAKQQPVASDLRKVIVSLKVSSDLERIGDLTVDMGKAALHMKQTNLLTENRSTLYAMSQKVGSMLEQVLTAFQTSNVLAAQHIAQLDDEIDRMYGEFVKQLFESNSTNPDCIEQVTQLAFIARYLERIADYGTNIAEWIIYEVNGQRFDLN
ncbi:phosphate signaling complex protein PhoU [Paenalkalicoccus suaedae]|uniref:Phosphate-specific transport system accessory protein PhoU n=1 Tax=Paenalkalicoccus suaedae TaxID=2592382 RepID=A0A859FFD9_9BACI|nr:phosphate signaling complex protein PhoU [Paenalkalicoccus suaedae]QKS71827.1 phosphate signaling complex protein PhoU [Paenalkalicoccus suaedae]